MTSGDELFAMISSVDANQDGEICFGEFLKVVNNGKFFSGGINSDDDNEDEVDVLEAFVSLGCVT
jgi:Ca2+-binding EF-hand superfamily protein